MKLQTLAESQFYFDVSNYVLHGNRLEIAKIFFEILAIFPFAFGYKIWRTFLKGAGVITASFFLILCVGTSQGVRELFTSRISSLAANLADWILYPLAIATCLSRLFLACAIHPSLFIRY